MVATRMRTSGDHADEQVGAASRTAYVSYGQVCIVGLSACASEDKCRDFDHVYDDDIISMFIMIMLLIVMNTTMTMRMHMLRMRDAGNCKSSWPETERRTSGRPSKAIIAQGRTADFGRQRLQVDLRRKQHKPKAPKCNAASDNVNSSSGMRRNPCGLRARHLQGPSAAASSRQGAAMNMRRSCAAWSFT